MKRFFGFFVGLVLVGLVRVTFAQDMSAVDATTEDERRYLIQISKELDHVRELARKAQAASDHKARVIFDYGSLISDLSDMKQSIENHIEKPNRSPRFIKPLSNDYEQSAQEGR